MFTNDIVVSEKSESIAATEDIDYSQPLYATPSPDRSNYDYITVGGNNSLESSTEAGRDKEMNVTSTLAEGDANNPASEITLVAKLDSFAASTEQLNNKFWIDATLPEHSPLNKRKGMYIASNSSSGVEKSESTEANDEWNPKAPPIVRQLTPRGPLCPGLSPTRGVIVPSPPPSLSPVKRAVFSIPGPPPAVKVNFVPTPPPTPPPLRQADFAVPTPPRGPPPAVNVNFVPTPPPTPPPVKHHAAILNKEPPAVNWSTLFGPAEPAAGPLVQPRIVRERVSSAARRAKREAKIDQPGSHVLLIVPPSASEQPWDATSTGEEIDQVNDPTSVLNTFADVYGNGAIEQHMPDTDAADDDDDDDDEDDPLPPNPNIEDEHVDATPTVTLDGALAAQPSGHRFHQTSINLSALSTSLLEDVVSFKRKAQLNVASPNASLLLPRDLNATYLTITPSATPSKLESSRLSRETTPMFATPNQLAQSTPVMPFASKSLHTSTPTHQVGHLNALREEGEDGH